jgi:regulator of replication initiation timing
VKAVSDRALEALAQMEDRFEQRIAELEDRVEDLENERDELKQENESLRERVNELEEQPEISMDGHDGKTLQIRNYPLGKVVTRHSERIDDVDDRLFDVERGAVDPGEVVAESGGPSIEELLPIHQNYLTVRHVDAGDHGLTQNQELAARVFPHWSEKADPSGGTLTLTSGQVRRIIETEIDTPEHRKRLDTEDPNPNTIRRVMKFIGQFGGELIELNRDPKTNRLEANRDDWVSYAETVVDATSDDTSAASTSAGGTPRATTDGGREIERS